MTPEQKARVSIDALLQQAGWHVCDLAHTNILAAGSVAVSPIGAQREIIAEIEKRFSRLDEGVGNLKRVKANLKRHTDSVYAEVFGGVP